jgi:ribose transport system permease protein
MKQINLSKIIEFATKYALFVVFVLLFLFFSLASPYFFNLYNFANIINQNAHLVIVVCGVALIMISGGTDLSVAYEMSLSAIIIAAGVMWWNIPLIVAIILGLIVATILGLLNGALAVRFKIHPMMITLATMTIYKGVAYLITKSQSIFNLPNTLKYLGQGRLFDVIPVSLFIMVVIIIIVSLLLNKTYLGRYTYAVGSNPEAARLAGINVGRTKIVVFGMGGFLIGIGALILLGRAGSANVLMASGAEFDAITACVLGGIALRGGEGKLWGAVTGVFILGILSNGMQLLGLDLNAQYIAKGVLLIAAIGFDTYQKSKIHLKKEDAK